MALTCHAGPQLRCARAAPAAISAWHAQRPLTVGADVADPGVAALAPGAIDYQARRLRS